MRLNIDYIFDDSESRVEGLQWKVLPEGSCALFVYDAPRLSKFHMSNVPTDLHLANIVGGVCVESVFMPMGSGDVYPLSEKTMCVVESRVEIPKGSKVDVDGGCLVVS